jgi:hypothetical protein
VATQKVRLEGHPARPRGSLLAVSLCLAVGLLLVTAGTALGISGFASPGPAARAQYPDAPGLQGPGPQPAISSLGSLMRVTRDIEREPKKVAARWRAKERADTRKATKAVLSAAVGGDARQSGSIALLLAGIAVLSVGGVLRWRREL